MSELKLAKLPDRKLVKLTINISPDLSHALTEYAAIYEASYGRAEPISNLVPYMLASFLESDRGFAKARRARS